MDRPGIHSLGSKTLTTAVTNEVITSSSDANNNTIAYVDRLHGLSALTLYAVMTYGSGGTTARVVIETSLDQGNTWVEIARFEFTTADAKKFAHLSSDEKVAVASYAALDSEGVNNGLLGDRLRAKVTSTGTYAGSTQISAWAHAR
jgi:hypothetical protein